MATASAGDQGAHWQTGQALGLTKAVRIGDREISQRALFNAALRTVARFCHTADEAITRHHVSRLRGLNDCGLQVQLVAHHAVVRFRCDASAVVSLLSQRQVDDIDPLNCVSVLALDGMAVRSPVAGRDISAGQLTRATRAMPSG
ncbi:hypothetical protein [Streptomyces sp. H62]